MRTTTFEILTKASTAKYPDEVCFAFNPNFIEIESAWPSATLTVSVCKLVSTSEQEEQSIKVSMYKGNAKIYLSRLFELLFTDPKKIRSLNAKVKVCIRTLVLFSFETLVVWGNLALGERFGMYGVFSADSGKRHFERNLIWFKNFPFKVSAFPITQNTSLHFRYDGGLYGSSAAILLSGKGFHDVSVPNIIPNAVRTATLKYKLAAEEIKTSVFDNTFDYTFFQSGQAMAIINLKISHDTAGYYLRWVDRHGNLQYFLFTKGETQYKNKLATDKVLQDEAINGTYFANIMRTRSLECTITMKCCAVNLPSDIFDYVVTVVSAPIVDLYLGKDDSGTEIWLPVNIQASTVKYIPKQTLNDLEFSFALPDVNAQSL